MGQCEQLDVVAGCFFADSSSKLKVYTLRRTNKMRVNVLQF